MLTLQPAAQLTVAPSPSPPQHITAEHTSSMQAPPQHASSGSPHQRHSHQQHRHPHPHHHSMAASPRRASRAYQQHAGTATACQLRRVASPAPAPAPPQHAHSLQPPTQHCTSAGTASSTVTSSTVTSSTRTPVRAQHAGSSTSMCAACSHQQPRRHHQRLAAPSATRFTKTQTSRTSSSRVSALPPSAPGCTWGACLQPVQQQQASRSSSRPRQCHTLPILSCSATAGCC
jgi:hypothetical protein